MWPSLIVAYPEQKMNVFRSQILFGFLTDPKMMIVQASFFGYRFLVGLRQKKGVHFRMKPSETASGLGFTSVICCNKLGNKSKTVLVL